MLESPRVVMTHWAHDDVRESLQEFCEPVAPSIEEGIWQRPRLLPHLEHAAGIVTCMADVIDKELLVNAPHLRVVAASAKGVDNIDVDACTRRRIWVSNLPDLLTAPTAEMAVGLMLALMRRITESDSHLRRGTFCGWRPTFFGSSLRGAVVGLIGLGQLGHAVARIVEAFGAEVMWYDPAPSARSAQAGTWAEAASMHELLERSDVIAPLMPLTSSTEHIIDGEALKRIRPGAFLINVARGSVVDETAVADALDFGRLGGYAADVFAFEDWFCPDRPREVPQRLLTSPQTVLTPHLGSAVDSVRREMGLAAAEQVRQALTGNRPDHAVNEVPT